MEGFPQVCFIKNTLSNPNILVGDDTYLLRRSRRFGRLRKQRPLPLAVHWHKLIIGRFCAIARGAKFIMNGANHKLSGISTYPFQIFGNGWEKVMPQPRDLPFKGDTVIGNDVWIGYDALIMPGVHIGNGAIVSSRSVVVADVLPTRSWAALKQRFTADSVARLESLAWWNWPIEIVTQHLELIVAGDIDALANVAPHS